MKKFFLFLFSLAGWMGIFAQGVSQGEYFWGADPGTGNGVALTAADGSFGDAIEEALAEEVAMNTEGAQTFNLRVRDEDGGWGPVFTVVINGDAPFSTVPEIQVTEAEYFWDDDPGEGNGNAMFAFDGNFDEAIETLINSEINPPGEGVHLLSIRARDAQNVWGQPFSFVVNIEPEVSSVRDVEVTAAEYYFDEDPGPGNGTSMLAVDGNFDAAIEAIKGGNIPSPVEEGIHVLWMRARDAENVWGPPFGVVVNMDITISGVSAEINGPVNFCEGDELIGIQYSTPATLGSTYIWTTTNGAVVEGQGTANVTVNWNPSGNRTLTLVQCLGDECEEETIEITVNPEYNVTDEAVICEGESIFLGGANQTQSGAYTDVYTTVAGCDSTVVTTLSVLSDIEVIEPVSICQGESYFAGGSNQTTSGSYSDVYTSSIGCDSTVVTELTVLEDILVNESAQVCQGGSIFLAGDFQSTPGNYTEVFTSAEGCDSIVVTNLSIIPAPIVTETVEICPGQSYFVGGAEQTEAGEYTDIEEDAEGCETVIVTTLVIESSVEVNETVEICAGSSYFVGGAEQTESGEYVDVETDEDGCEITLITNLVVLPPESTSVDVEICSGQSYFAGGADQTESGEYSDFETNDEGCTIELVTNLSVLPPAVVEATAEICEGGSIFLGGEMQTEPGVYTDLEEDADGCEYILETTLSVVDEIQNEVNTLICEGDSLFVGGNWQSDPGNFTDTFETEAGCDSVVVTSLSFLPPVQVNDQAEICEGDSLFVGGDYQFSNGFYTDVLTAVNGCDSTVTTLLSVLPAPNPDIVLSGGVLTTGQFPSYQWYFNGEAVDGATNQFFIPENEGVYVVEVSNADGCTGFSDDYNYIVDHVANEVDEIGLTVFPNPGRDIFNVVFNEGGHTVSGLRVYDLTGRMLEPPTMRTDKGWSVDLRGKASGSYLFIITTTDRVIRKRVLLTR